MEIESIGPVGRGVEMVGIEGSNSVGISIPSRNSGFIGLNGGRTGTIFSNAKSPSV